MDFVCVQVILLSSCLILRGSTLAMVQHPTSSQSIVFHPQPPSGSSSIGGSSGADQYPSTPAKYDYKYEVSDLQTGDRKSHWESRDGDRVRGAYTVYEPNGALRTVEYTADSLHGFNAVVRRDEPKHGGLGSYNPPSNSVHDGYESNTQARYSPETNSYSTPGSSGSGRPGTSGYSPGVGYTIDHRVAPRIESVRPY